MKVSIDRRQLLFYLLIGIVFMIMWIIGVKHSRPEEEFFSRSINYLWFTVYVTALNFIVFEYIAPQLSWRKWIRAIMILFTLMMLYSFGLYAWRQIGIGLHLYTSYRIFEKAADGVEYHVPFSFASIFFFGIVRHIYNYIKLKRATQKLRVEKQQAELNYLKSQTNPHFLFNTLNNIYALARDKSDVAPESILCLSKILRFMLYETSGDYIAIEQELKIMDDYIALEKLRYDESLHVNFSHNIENMKQALPPLLLIPLVENAFKHGVSETRDQPFVNIFLSINKGRLEFTVKNSVEAFSGEVTVKENIGLSNLRRQLELLYTDYNLTVQHNGSVFEAILKINLASHV